MFSLLQRYFGFTRNEVKVILFLTTTFLAGLAIRWFRSSWDNQHAPTASTDYSEQDSIFLERSRRLLQSGPAKTVENTSKTGQHGSLKKTAPQPHSIDLNRASEEQLILLPGIGKAYAERIVAYRTNHGPFRSVDELDHVRGIGKKTIKQLRLFVFVSSTDATSVKPP